MDDIVYSEKQIAIFNAVIELMRDGINPYSIKVSDIAQVANIGKGTIYDYFDSKEEAISEAILYSISNEIDVVYSRVEGKNSFKEKFYELLYTIVENTTNNISTFNMLLSVGGIAKFYEYLLDDKYDLSKYVSMVNHTIEHILDAGIDEGIIRTDESRYYQIMVVNSAIMGFSQHVRQKELYPQISNEEAMKLCYKSIVKILG